MFKSKKRDVPDISKPSLPPDAPAIDTAALRREIAARDGQIAEALQSAASQHAFVRQQIAQLSETVKQLAGEVGAQHAQSVDTDKALRQELQKLQTGGAQPALAGPYPQL